MTRGWGTPLGIASLLAALGAAGALHGAGKAASCATTELTASIGAAGASPGARAAAPKGAGPRQPVHRARRRYRVQPDGGSG